MVARLVSGRVGIWIESCVDPRFMLFLLNDAAFYKKYSILNYFFFSFIIALLLKQFTL